LATRIGCKLKDNRRKVYSCLPNILNYCTAETSIFTPGLHSCLLLLDLP